MLVRSADGSRWMHSVDLCRAGYRCGASTVTRAGSLTRSSALFSAFNHRRNTGGPILIPRRKHQRTACSYFGCFGGCLWEKKVRTMVPARGALRSKVFMATWLDISTDTSAYDGTRTGRRLAENQYSGPRCQVSGLQFWGVPIIPVRTVRDVWSVGVDG